VAREVQLFRQFASQLQDVIMDATADGVPEDDGDGDGDDGSGSERGNGLGDDESGDERDARTGVSGRGDRGATGTGTGIGRRLFGRRTATKAAVAAREAAATAAAKIKEREMLGVYFSSSEDDVDVTLPPDTKKQRQRREREIKEMPTVRNPALRRLFNLYDVEQRGALDLEQLVLLMIEMCIPMDVWDIMDFAEVRAAVADDSQ
jgi:hypothetical protein